MKSFANATAALVEPISATEQLTENDLVQARNIDVKGAKLHPHQEEGVAWMLKRWDCNRNVIVADEMGLGKTLQTLAFLSALMSQRSQTGPFLVVAPLSVAPQWIDQVLKLLPSLRCFEYLGSAVEREVKRRLLIEEHILKLPKEVIKSGDPQPLPFDVMISTYETCLADIDFVEKLKWRVIVYDEGHRLKSPSGVTHQTFASRLQARFKVILTGTPIQNNFLEFWALLKFLHPEIFTESTIPDREIDMLHMSRVVSAVVLRRLFSSIQGKLVLPDMRHMVIRTDMTTIQSDLYKWALFHYAASLRGADTTSPPAGILSNLMMTLRKIASHPYLIAGVEPEPFSEGDHLWRNSNKLRVLKALLAKMKTENGKSLIFSGFTSLLDIVQDFLDLENIAYERLDGSVRKEDRVSAIQRFGKDEAEGPSVFLLSTRAGGVGLNLAAANWVIFLDTDWNPQMDLQAIARAHRQGQTREVKVFRLVTKGSVDEIIFARSVDKLKFAQSVLNENDLGQVEVKELRNLVAYGADRLVAAEVSNGTMPVASRDSAVPEEENIDDLIESLEPSKSVTADELVVVGKDQEYRCFEGIDYTAGTVGEEPADLKAIDALVAKVRTLPPSVLGAPKATARPAMTSEQKERFRKMTEENRIKRKEEKWRKIGYSSYKLDSDNSSDGPLVATPGTIHHVHGSVASPTLPDSDHPSTVVVHQVDTSGVWPTNSSLFMALAVAFPDVPKQYFLMKKASDLHFGDVHLVPTRDQNVFVALCVCHRDEDFEVLKKSLETLSGRFKGESAIFHFSRIGDKCSSLYVTERLINRYICGLGFDAFMYYWSRSTAPPHAPEPSIPSSPPQKRTMTLMDYFNTVMGDSARRSPKLSPTPPRVNATLKFALSPLIRPAILAQLYSKMISDSGGSVVDFNSDDADVYATSIWDGKEGIDTVVERLSKNGKSVAVTLGEWRRDRTVRRVITTENLEYLLRISTNYDD